MHNVMAGHVQRGAVPGLVTLISRRGETHVDAIGVKAVGGRDPVRRDTIFRIASVTKPITAVATLILVEESKLRLDEPVDRLLPELANRRVLRRIDGPVDDTVPAKRPITVRDLLTFRLGLGLLFPPEPYPINKAINALEIVGFGPPNVATPHTPDEWMRRLGTLPLMHQPGDKWMYNVGSYVLGVLIARAAGQPLETFLRDRIVGPLGMKDTSFSVPAGKLDRFVTAYWTNPQTGELILFDKPDGQWSRPPAFPDGGGGLVSTVDDLLAFGQMLLNNGKLGSVRILSRPSVETMTADQLTAEQKSLSNDLLPGYFDSHGWGFGVSVITRREDPSGPIGKFGWDGGLGTSWYVDPREEMITILMTQAAFTSPSAPPVVRDFWTGAYQAIDD
jgi:CubicO group peptidase (beta-lactamase class C family)